MQWVLCMRFLTLFRQISSPISLTLYLIFAKFDRNK